jgi:enoyl-[acyl-carrier protein] reductase I
MALRLKGKVAAIFGYANNRSIAWGVAQRFQKEGGVVVIGIQSERFRPSLVKATEDWPVSPVIVECNVTDDANIDTAFATIAATHGRLDILVHSIAHATQPAMRGALLDCTRTDFLAAHDISAYSLIGLSRGAAPLLRASGCGAVIAMSYLGAERVVPNYKVMSAAKSSLQAVARQLAFEMVCACAFDSCSTRTRLILDACRARIKFASIFYPRDRSIPFLRAAYLIFQTFVLV